MAAGPPHGSIVALERLAGDQADLGDCLEIRRRVFVEGQGVAAAIDIDGLDRTCSHFLARVQGQPVGTARLRRVDGALKAERVAVLPEHRSRGVGAALMAALEATAREAGASEVVLHAQERVASFYERLGYRRLGAVFLEADIPHVEMIKRLR